MCALPLTPTTCSYKEDLGVISATIDAAMSAALPPGVERTLYLCDDGKVTPVAGSRVCSPTVGRMTGAPPPSLDVCVP